MQKVGGEDVDQHKPHQFRQVVWFAQVLEGAGSAIRIELRTRSAVMTAMQSTSESPAATSTPEEQSMSRNTTIRRTRAS